MLAFVKVAGVDVQIVDRNLSEEDLEEHGEEPVTVASTSSSYGKNYNLFCMNNTNLCIVSKYNSSK